MKLLGYRLAIALVASAVAAATSKAQCERGGCPAPLPPDGGWQPVERRIAPQVIGRTPHPAVCRIVNDSHNGQSLGSGTLVAKSTERALVLTCAHLFDSGTKRIVVAFPAGEEFRARLVALDSINDLAAIATDPPSCDPVDVDAESQDNLLRACGYGQSGTYACATGRVVGYSTPVGAADRSTKIGGAVRLGDSGGAVFDQSGALVGVVWGVRNGVTYATCGRPLQRFLGRFRDWSRPAGRRPQIANRGQNAPASGTKPNALGPEIVRRLDELGDRVKALEGQTLADVSPAPDWSRFATQQELDIVRDKSKVQQEQLLDHLGRLGDQIKRDAARAAQEAVRTRIAEVVGDVTPGATAKWLSTVLGLSGPASLAVSLFAWLGLRRIKRRISGAGGRREGTFHSER